MKRIASLVMAVLMVVTTFCGILSVTSTADEVYDACTNLAQVTVEAEVAEDGTIDVKWWVKDNSPYGFYFLGFDLTWDENKVEPVSTYTYEEQDLYINLSNLQYWIDEATSNTIKRKTKSEPAIGSMTVIDYDEWVIYADPGVSNVAIKRIIGSYSKAAQFSMDYMDEYGIDYTMFEMDETKGLLCAEMKFQVKDGATGDAAFGATTMAGNLAAIDDASDGNYAYENLDDSTKENAVAITTDSVPVGEEESSAVTLVTKNSENGGGASIRTAAPAGIRFSGSITATDWTNVTEFGIRVSKGGVSQDIKATVDATGAVIDISALEAGATVNFNAVISGLKEANYAADFTAQAYVKYGDNSEELSESTCVANAAAVATTALNDASATYTEEQKAYLETLAAAASAE